MAEGSGDEYEEQVLDGATGSERILAAAKRDHVDMLKEVLAEAPGSFDVNAVDGIGWSALHYCGYFDSAEVAALLLEQPGINPNIKNRQWETPLHVAASNGCVQIVRLLIEHGANPSAVTKAKDSVLDLCADDEARDLVNSAILAKKLGAAYTKPLDDGETDEDATGDEAD
eukprot:Opistho-1_new@52082